MKVKVCDFSKTPNARYRDDGDYSGEEFYEIFLKNGFQQSVKNNEKLIVDLDGTEGYATSFLDEAFGRLAEEFGPLYVLDNLQIISNEEPDWLDEITTYILERNEIK